MARGSNNAMSLWRSFWCLGHAANHRDAEILSMLWFLCWDSRLLLVCIWLGVSLSLRGLFNSPTAAIFKIHQYVWFGIRAYPQGVETPSSVVWGRLSPNFQTCMFLCGWKGWPLWNHYGFQRVVKLYILQRSGEMRTSLCVYVVPSSCQFVGGFLGLETAVSPQDVCPFDLWVSLAMATLMMRHAVSRDVTWVPAIDAAVEARARDW